MLNRIKDWWIKLVFEIGKMEFNQGGFHQKIGRIEFNLSAILNWI